MADYNALKFEFEGQQLIAWTRYNEITEITTAEQISGLDRYDSSNFNRADIPPEKYDALRRAVESSFEPRDATFYEDADMEEILLKNVPPTPDE